MGTTTGFWRELPTALGAEDRLELDAPLGAGVLQTAASSACHAARQNNLATLWEHPGGDVWENLTSAFYPVDNLHWWGEDSAGVFARYCGAFRLRPFGETQRLPTIELRARYAAPSTYTTGIMLVARRERGRPSGSDQFALATTTSTSLTNVSLSIATRAESIGREAIACRAAGVTDLPDEQGDLPLVHLYVGAWCTSGGGAAKGSLSGISIFLKEPP
mgnify:CR=1 FL=1